MRLTTRLATLTFATLAAAVPAHAGDDHDSRGRIDFGLKRDKLLQENAEELFGVRRGLGASSTASITAAEADADPTRLLTVAPGLRVRTVAAGPQVPANIDQMVLWPDDRRPTHIIACNEEGPAEPGLVRIRLRDGAVETIVSGTNSCDPVRRTTWGTIVFGEEAGPDGHLIELINPLGTTGVTYNRATGAFSGGQNPGNLAVLNAPGSLSYEGIALYPNGVMYYGDELRPSRGTPGGAYYKFIPEKPWTGGSAITKLSDSPLASGSVYGLRVGVRSGNTDYGQGSQTGFGVWLPIPGAVPGAHPPVNLGAQAAILKLTGYYRPEDIDIDRAALAVGNVRFCGNNTGNEATDHNWGETICITDGTVAQALANTGKPELQFLVVGWADFAMMDNIAYQPKLGNWVINEDGDGAEFGRNNDIWSCLDDGKDLDGLSDGCIKVATINDLNAETTGGFFNGDGSVYYVSIQHNVTGHGVILAVTGWDYHGDDRWDD